MTTYLLDTNVILRLSNPADAQHGLVTKAIAALLTEGDECYLAPQTLIELWAVATRPIQVNGLGWSAAYTHHMIGQLMQHFPLANEPPSLFFHWLEIVSTHNILGKHTHDARIVALMKGLSINHILTLNPTDFTNLADIVVVHPQQVVR